MNEQILISIGSVLAFSIFFKLSISKINSVITDYQEEVKNKIASSESVRNDAYNLFQKYTKEKKELDQKISDTIEGAKNQAEEIIEKAKKESLEKHQRRVLSAKKQIDYQNKKLIEKFDKKFVTTTINAMKNSISQTHTNTNVDSKRILDLVGNINTYH